MSPLERAAHASSSVVCGVHGVARQHARVLRTSEWSASDEAQGIRCEETTVDTLYCRVAGRTDDGRTLDITVACRRIRRVVFDLCRVGNCVRVARSEEIRESGFVWIRRTSSVPVVTDKDAWEEQPASFPPRVSRDDAAQALRAFPQPGRFGADRSVPPDVAALIENVRGAAHVVMPRIPPGSAGGPMPPRPTLAPIALEYPST